MDHRGNIIRNPNDVLWGWSLEQVMEAVDLQDVRNEGLMRKNEQLKREREAAARQPKRRK